MNISWENICYPLIFLAGFLLGRLVNIVLQYFVDKIGSNHLQTTRSSLIGSTNSTLMNLSRKGRLETHKWGERLTELVSAVGAVLLFIKFGVSLNFFAVIIFCASLLAVSRIDMQAMIIPDVITLSGTIVGFILSSLNYDPYMDWKSSLTGILIGVGMLYVPAYIFRLFKGTDGIGGGDIKLIGMVGSFIGAQGVLFTILIASLGGYVLGLIGAICKRTPSKAVIPFGPFISSSAVLYVFCGKTIINNIFVILYFFFES